MQKLAILKTAFLFTISAIYSSALFAANNTEIPIYTEQKSNIYVTASQPQFTIKLKSNPTTGFAWFLREYNSRLVQPLKHSFVAPTNEKLIGAPGYELWTFKILPSAFNVPHQTLIRFNYVRPWENDNQATGVVFWISTQEMVKK